MHVVGLLSCAPTNVTTESSNLAFDYIRNIIEI